MKLPKRFNVIHFSWRVLFSFWFHYARTFFILLFFSALMGGVYVWYENVYHGQWNEEEKQRYIESAFKETVFKRSDFLNAMEAVRKRADAHSADMEVGKDIFNISP